MVNNNSSLKSVCFVNTSGRAKRCYWMGIRLPFFMAWPLFKICYNFLGIKVGFLGFKEETIARFNAACELVMQGKAEKLFVSGAYEDNPEAPNLTQEYFLNKGLAKNQVCADGISLDTTGNVEQFINQLQLQYPAEKSFSVFVVDAFYRMSRTIWALNELAKKSSISLAVNEVSVRPKLTWRSFKEDYLFNVLSEWPRGFMDKIGLRKLFLDLWRKTKKEF